MRGFRDCLAVMSASLLLTAGAALADPKEVETLGAGLPQLGAGFDEVRAMVLPDGERLVCDSDMDKPRLENPRFMDPPSGRRGGERVRRCSVFAPGSDGTWRAGAVPSLGGPARLWMTFVEQGGAGRFRLALLSLWAGRDGWDKVAKAMTALQGESLEGDGRYLTWLNETHETTMFVDEKNPEEFAVSVSDIRLRHLIRSSGGSTRPE